MLSINIIWIGKTTNPAIEKLSKQFLDRLKPLVNLDITEIKDPKLGSKTTSVLKEKELIQKKIKNGTYLIILDETGLQYTSIQFSNNISELKSKGKSHMTFIIGGSHGINDDLIEQSDLVLSFSKMTFTHEMIRPFLFEQIYRACMIEAGSKYHH